MAGMEPPVRSALIPAGRWVSSSAVTLYHLHGKRPVIRGSADLRWHTAATAVPGAVLVSANWAGTAAIPATSQGIVDPKTDRIPFAA